MSLDSCATRVVRSQKSRAQTFCLSMAVGLFCPVCINILIRKTPRTLLWLQTKVSLVSMETKNSKLVQKPRSNANNICFIKQHFCQYGIRNREPYTSTSAQTTAQNMLLSIDSNMFCAVVTDQVPSPCAFFTSFTKLVENIEKKYHSTQIVNYF